MWDVSPAFGGRLIRDKLWFFVSYRDFGIVQTRAGIYDNATPLGWVYTPDRSRGAFIKVTNVSRNARVTWQATPRNKISLFVDSAPHAFWQHGAHNPASALARGDLLPRLRSAAIFRRLVEVASHESVAARRRRLVYHPGV